MKDQTVIAELRDIARAESDSDRNFRNDSYAAHLRTLDELEKALNGNRKSILYLRGFETQITRKKIWSNTGFTLEDLADPNIQKWLCESVGKDAFCFAIQDQIAEIEAQQFSDNPPPIPTSIDIVFGASAGAGKDMMGLMAMIDSSVLGGVPKLYLSNENWQNIVTKLIQIVDRVVIFFDSQNDGLWFEIEELYRLGMGDKTLVLVGNKSKKDKQLDLPVRFKKGYFPFFVNCWEALEDGLLNMKDGRDPSPVIDSWLNGNILDRPSVASYYFQCAEEAEHGDDGDEVLKWYYLALALAQKTGELDEVERGSVLIRATTWFDLGWSSHLNSEFEKALFRYAEGLRSLTKAKDSEIVAPSGKNPLVPPILLKKGLIDLIERNMQLAIARKPPDS